MSSHLTTGVCRRHRQGLLRQPHHLCVVRHRGPNLRPFPLEAGFLVMPRLVWAAFGDVKPFYVVKRGKAQTHYSGFLVPMGLVPRLV